MTIVRFRPGRFDPTILRVNIEAVGPAPAADNEIRLLDDPPAEPVEVVPIDPATLPRALTSELRDDVIELDVPVDAAPTWAWRFTEVYRREYNAMISTVRHVPVSTNPLEYDELVILDPTTLTPNEAAEPLWRNVVDQVVVLQAVTVQAAQSAIGSAQAAGAASADAASQAEQAAAVARRILSTTVTWDPVPIAAGGFTSALVNWADVELGHMVGIAPLTDIGNGVQIYAVASTAGRVRLTIRNLLASAIDLPATTFRLYRIQVPA